MENVKEVKIIDLSQENTKRLNELVMMATDIDILLNGNSKEEAINEELKAIECVKDDIVSQNNLLKKLANKMLKIKNALS